MADATADYSARSSITELVQTQRSHEILDIERFRNLSGSQERIEKLIKDLGETVEKGFANYDRKFWSLAVTTITLLATACGALIIKLLVFPTH